MHQLSCKNGQNLAVPLRCCIALGGAGLGTLGASSVSQTHQERANLLAKAHFHLLLRLLFKLRKHADSMKFQTPDVDECLPLLCVVEQAPPRCLPSCFINPPYLSKSKAKIVKLEGC